MANLTFVNILNHIQNEDKMTDHYKLVEYFFSGFYKNKAVSHPEIISPNFAFSSVCPISDIKSSNKPDEIINAYNKRKIRVIKIISLDDINFLVTFSMLTLNSKNLEYEIALVVVKNNMIERLEVRQNK